MAILFDARDRGRRSATGASPARRCARRRARSSSRPAKASCWRPAATATTRAIAKPSCRSRHRCIRWRADQPGRRHRHRRKARRAHRAAGAPPQRIVDAGFGHAARRRQQGALPASAARPRQAGPDRRQRRRRALRQRSGVVSRLCRRHVRAPHERAVDPVLSDLRRGVHQKIRARPRLSRRRDLRACSKPDISNAAETLDELAAARSASTAGLRGTVARHNGFAQTGIDTDFGKGETELNRFNGDDAHKPNPCIGPIATAPYYGIAIWPADIAVATGLSTDADARVLDQAGQPIAGLYACGNDMASMMRGSYPGPGTTLGPGMVFAYRAATHAAGKQPLEEPIAGA